MLPGHLPLHIQQHIPHYLVGRYQRCLLGNILRADLIRYIHTVHQHVLLAGFIVFNFNGQLVNITLDTVHILGADTQQVKEVRNGAIDSAGIHIIVAQFLGKCLGDSTFACAGRTVNGDAVSLRHNHFLVSFISAAAMLPKQPFLWRPPLGVSGPVFYLFVPDP